MIVEFEDLNMVKNRRDIQTNLVKSVVMKVTTTIKYFSFR